MKHIIIEHSSSLTEDELAAAERQLGVNLPDDYRSFMLRYNGGQPEPDGFDVIWRDDRECGQDWRTSTLSWFLSLDERRGYNLLKYNQPGFAGRIPRGTIAIAVDAGGNLILLALEGPYAGRILFWVREYEVEEGEEPGYDNVGIIADNFDQFLNEKLR
jgi:SMI1 / KNR4 family (SUKH-1)